MAFRNNPCLSGESQLRSHAPDSAGLRSVYRAVTSEPSVLNLN